MKKLIFSLLLIFALAQPCFGGVSDLIKDKPQKEKSNIKGVEIARVVKAQPRQKIIFSGADIDIEIISSKAIEGGVEIMARAWNGAKPIPLYTSALGSDIKKFGLESKFYAAYQILGLPAPVLNDNEQYKFQTGEISPDEPIGFGKDGSVEIERFKIYNPPIMVDDNAGPIIRNNTDIDGKITQRRLREDPEQSIKESLVHTIKVTGKDGRNIISGKTGNTTSTFYPAAGANEPVDGYVQRNVVNETWATIIAGAGTSSSNTESFYIYITATATTDQWSQLVKAIVLFVTSPIPDTDDVNSVVLSVFGEAKADLGGLAPNVDIYTSTPASTSSLVAADFQQIGSVSQTGSPITYANFTTGTYNDFTFNATGRGNINKTGISPFGLRNANYDVAAVAPAWSSLRTANVTGYSADVAGTSSDPKLVVVHSAPGSFIPKINIY